MDIKRGIVIGLAAALVGAIVAAALALWTLATSPW